VTRRTFVTLLAFVFGGIGLVALLPLRILDRLPGYGAWLERRVSRALRALVAGQGAAAPPASVLGWSRDGALERLVEGRSPLQIARAFADEESMRAFLAERRDEDFRTGRVEFLEGWLLSESEISVAVLLGDESDAR
jgi:hypothetical protein